jgi:hypothetical protein
MLLALAVLMFQSAAFPASLPTNVHSAVGMGKTIETPGAAAAHVQVNPALVNLPVTRSFSGGILMAQEQSTPVKDEKAAQNTAQVQTPAALVNFPAMQAATWIMLGQLEPAAMGESSSRGDALNPPAVATASFKPAPYTRVSEAGRAYGLPRKWLMLGAVEHGAATFDAWSTRRVIENGSGYEMNPLLKPFANSNALYGAVQVAPFAFDYIALRMLHSEHPWMRKYWWVPQSASAATSIFAGLHNSMMH